ncbi:MULTISPECIES: response regulator transcription factor [unclassified Lentimicrobium]|uniref:response regulator transcription factor n=1 Tax=unclassified Lentimicrobium TaxID=2677434 RepID=UPI0015554173|nr:MULTISPECIES: response regulator transcription factor [unclassified Lentimicrobium]NPD44687.1 response regulator transcription factor [Lentimicrobium sp. S6]NPD83457.1 response regulator transcription factor [Lentimicrobium sp. L6]
MTQKLKIAIAEDNSFLLQSIIDKLSFLDNVQIKHCSENGELLLKKLEEYSQIDVVLMDIQMPKMDGIEATSILKSKYPQIKVVMLTIFDDDENIFKAIQAGADGYLLKETGPAELDKSLKETINGGAPMTPIIASKALQLLRFTPESFLKKEENPLSNRETQVLEQLSKGLNYQEIAENLIISPSTVRKHIENIYKKLQVRNKMEAVNKADKNAWLK